MKNADNEKYIKRGPLAVLAAVKELQRNDAMLRVSFARGQFISRVLDADENQLIFDQGSNAQDNRLMENTLEANISAESQGARIEFSLAGLEKVDFENLPAWRAPLPDVLWKIQRREFFRVSAPLAPIFWCYSQWPDGRSARFRLQDLSLGGIGVLVDEPIPDDVFSGVDFDHLRVELGEYGQFEVGAQLLNIGQRISVSSKNETITTPRLSFRFTTIEPVQERQLQQVIFALERLAREKATRFM